MSNTVINIYGDVHIGHITINNGVTTIGEAISDSIKDSVYRQLKDGINHESKTKYNDERWSNDAERDAWRRFYRANSYT